MFKTRLQMKVGEVMEAIRRDLVDAEKLSNEGVAEAEGTLLSLLCIIPLRKHLLGEASSSILLKSLLFTSN